MADWSRRDFLEFAGKTASVGAMMAGAPLGCALPKKPTKPAFQLPSVIPYIEPQALDGVVLAHNLRAEVVALYNAPINRSERFGANADYIEFVPIDQNNAFLWVNHEFPETRHFETSFEKSKERVDIERSEVGATILRVRRVGKGSWRIVQGDPLNRRITSTTPIPIVAPRDIKGKTIATGTLANCSGGLTPWGTVLTCEENYEHFYGYYDPTSALERRLRSSSDFRWLNVYDEPPETFGWVNEFDPKTGKGKKLTAMGRFGHESATIRVSKDGRCVVYSGDDMDFGSLYKYIAKAPGTLEEGELFAANIEEGRWISLSRGKHPELQKLFADDLEALIWTRQAAKVVGASELDRPEDIAIDPASGAVFVALTKNERRNNLFGQLLRIVEKDNDPLAMTFTSETFLTGGEQGLACPDNLMFDRQGNLWVTTDIGARDIQKYPAYAPFKNNGLFYIPFQGPQAGKVFQMASAPVGAEFSGPCFSSDAEVLFLAVQHPGEGSTAAGKYQSHWPEGGDSPPRSGILAISGATLEALVG